MSAGEHEHLLGHPSPQFVEGPSQAYQKLVSTPADRTPLKFLREVVRSEKRGLRRMRTLACGHTIDCIHLDDHVVCMDCMMEENKNNEHE